MSDDAGLVFGSMFLFLLIGFAVILVVVFINLVPPAVQIGFGIGFVIWLIIKVSNAYDARKAVVNK